MKRKKLTKRANRKDFKLRAMKIHTKNLPRHISRGGYCL